MNIYDPERDYINDYIEQWNRTTKRAKAGMIILGVLLAIAGVGCAVAPVGTYALLQGIVAAMLVLHGVGQIATYLQTPEFFRNGGQLACGILNAVLGVLLFTLPPAAMAGTIVYLMAFLLIMTGIERISFARQMRFYQIPSSSMGTATGVLNIILGVAFLFMPIVTSLMLSYLVAGYLIVIGITLVIEGISIKPVER